MWKRDDQPTILEALSIAATDMESLRKVNMRKGNFVLEKSFREKRLKFSLLFERLQEEWGEDSMLTEEMRAQLEELYSA